MTSRTYLDALWAATLLTIAVGAVIIDSAGGLVLIFVAATMATLALWLELSRRIDDEQ